MSIVDPTLKPQAVPFTRVRTSPDQDTTIPLNLSFGGGTPQLRADLPYPFNGIQCNSYDFSTLKLNTTYVVNAIQNAALALQFSGGAKRQGLFGMFCKQTEHLVTIAPPIVRDFGGTAIGEGSVSGIVTLLTSNPCDIVIFKVIDEDLTCSGQAFINFNTFELDPYLYGGTITFAAS